MEKRKSPVVTGPPTMVMQSFQDMGTKGRRKMQWAGGILMAMASTAGLIVPLIATPPIAYYILVGVIFVVGAGFFWPQYGVLILNAIPAGIAKIIPSRLLSRPERRSGPRGPAEEDEG